MSVIETWFVLDTKVGFKLVERKEGRRKGKREGSQKKGGKRKEERKLAGWLMHLPCQEAWANIWPGFQPSKEVHRSPRWLANICCFEVRWQISPFPPSDVMPPAPPALGYLTDKLWSLPSWFLAASLYYPIPGLYPEKFTIPLGLPMALQDAENPI